jgi:Flp pilus assembly protein CpaB
MIRPMTLLAVSEQGATDILVAAVLVASFVALGIVAWIFWRAAKRDRQAGRS